MKKILWITNNWLYEFGGRKIASKKILKGLSYNGWSITVIDFEVKTNFHHVDRRLIELEPKIIFFCFFLKEYKYIFFELQKIIKSKTFDVIICSGFSSVDLFSFLSIKILRLCPKAKIVLFEHSNPYASTNLSYITHRYFFSVVGFLFYRFFDYIITPGQGIKDMFIRRYYVPTSRIIMIRYPVLSTYVHNLKKERIDEVILKKWPHPIIITAARLNSYQKDFMTLFTAVKFILTKKKILLVILGNGPDKKQIFRLAKDLGIDNYLYPIGFKKNPYKYFAHSDLFVLSSHFEGSPLVLAEALACKLPIVATDTDFGPREIVTSEKTGLLVPQNDPKAMARAILTILKNPKKYKISKKISDNIIEIYSEKEALNRWHAFLSSIT